MARPGGDEMQEPRQWSPRRPSARLPCTPGSRPASGTRRCRTARAERVMAHGSGLIIRGSYPNRDGQRGACKRSNSEAASSSRDRRQVIDIVRRRRLEQRLQPSHLRLPKTKHTGRHGHRRLCGSADGAATMADRGGSAPSGRAGGSSHRTAAAALDTERQEACRIEALDQDMAAVAGQRAAAGSNQDRAIARLDEMRLGRHPAASLDPGEQLGEPALFLLLDDRRVADIRALAQRGIFPQALRLLRRIDLHVLGFGLRQYSTLSMKLSSALPGWHPGRSGADIARRGAARSAAAARPDLGWRCPAGCPGPTAAPTLPPPAPARSVPADAGHRAAADADYSPAASKAARASSRCIRPAHPGSGQRCATVCRRCSRPAASTQPSRSGPIRLGLDGFVRMRRSLLIHLLMPQVRIGFLEESPGSDQPPPSGISLAAAAAAGSRSTSPGTARRSPSTARWKRMRIGPLAGARHPAP